MSSKTHLDCSKCEGGGLLRGRQLDVDHFEADVACDECDGNGKSAVLACGHDVDQRACECHDSNECHECWFESEAAYWGAYFGVTKRGPVAAMKPYHPDDEHDPEYRDAMNDAGRGHLLR